ncbi:hypothetical protein [Haloarcula pellucida]|uniref:DUF4352 domain-containing protein n=1 Tax=Haloarcula pellucida TaxID=1427151 RepID=A0A830GT06_9EURY|nr:hypothetical protein [Halomicroarcula pellucida]MBX0350526.1 DUF4352 domain-containing protein [Halomicroarcula pellucida]GGO03741.1 hypothetical protein GCM10009030_39720 [Halomicroarcula pellucida]
MVEITLRNVLGYLFGLPAILGGLVFALVSPVSGLLLILAGVLALPVVRRQFDVRAGLSFSSWAVVGLVLLLSVASLSVLALTVGDGGQQSLGESKTASGLSVVVTDYEIHENVDLNNNDPIDPNADALLVKLRVEHVGENERVFPHQVANEIQADYNDEPLASALTYRNITVDNTTYHGYHQSYRGQDADGAYQGTTVSGWVAFEVPPNAEPSDMTVTVYWGPDRNQKGVWQLSSQ